MANIKSYSSIPHNSSHSRPSQALFQYVLTHVLCQASQKFVQVAYTKKCFIPDLPSFKKTMQSSKASK